MSISGFGYFIFGNVFFYHYCCSFYGSPLWHLNSSLVDYICVACKLSKLKIESHYCTGCIYCTRERVG